MILREPRLNRADCEFIASCYEDWPVSKRGPVYPSDVRTWIKGFPRRPEQGLIGEDGEAVSFVLFGVNFFAAKIFELAVPVEKRGLGHGKATWKALQARLSAEGVVVAEFDAIPGIVADKVLRGDFAKVGEGIGENTGLPVVIGQVRADDDLS